MPGPPMRLKMREAAIASGALVAGILGTVLVMSSDETYEECMIRNMRGQPDTMMISAYDLCKRLKKAND